MTEQQALEFIHSMPRLPKQPNLNRIRRLMERLGNPQRQLRFIHVAGTNGKGSTCAMLSSILKHSGFRTGLFISPYILNFRERMQINGVMIAPEELAALTERLCPIVEQMQREGDSPVEFELVTAIALTWFAQSRCDIVVLEVGIGGRLDATNIIDCPLASVICTIDFDHMAMLGDTLAEIAAEKCGIIKSGGITIASPQPSDEAAQVIRHIAQERGNRLLVSQPEQLPVLARSLSGTEIIVEGQPILLPLIGDHQLTNTATVLCTIEALRSVRQLVIPPQAVCLGLSQVLFPARMEPLCRYPLILLDGAHNPSGARALSETIKTYLPNRTVIGVIGMLRDKDYEQVLSLFAQCFSSAVTLMPDTPRALPALELAEAARLQGLSASPAISPIEAVRKAVSLAGDDGAVVICGSLYLAASLRPVVLEFCQNPPAN